ncbi:hypothetical protein GCM10010218_15760 [Streptomyces mashuensis]|uniref:HTH luxR-type domain-containing protein n=1 Tax=Streptomyces mashuensis TaxID=33904 RepID=A0A919B013_9ACTN|nr:LuxR C-terminal-related transcriptional regulator [Streptomyces mashuensis]GHF35370.1 hypothetical protein GCM10010218_15760 [Streptomyces mashuensis]
MAGLRTRDYEQLLDFVVAVLENPDPEGGWQLVTEQLLTTLGCDSATYSDLDPAEGTGRVEGWAPDRLSPYVNGLVQRRVRQHHPLIGYVAAGRSAPVAVADLCPDLDRAPWYREACRDFGITRQLGVPVGGRPGRVRMVLLGRDGEFRDGDVTLAVRLQPLLTAFAGHVHELRRLRGPAAPAEHGLTPRELTVLGLMAEGLTAEGIARRLAISRHTVNRHAEKIYRKLGTNNRVSTVLLARQAGLVR